MRPNDHCVGLRTRRLRRADRTRLGFGVKCFVIGDLDDVDGWECFVGAVFDDVAAVEEESFVVSEIVIVSEESFVGFEFVVVVAAVAVVDEDVVVADDEFFNRFSWKPMAYKRGKAKII